jgi:hypothetical protein
MPRTVLTAVPFPGGASGFYPTLPVTPGSLAVSLTANDGPTDFETVIVDGKTFLLAHNTDTIAQTLTITSVPDAPFNRSGDIDAYSLAAGALVIVGLFKKSGWANQPGDNLFIDVSDPKLRLAVRQIP